MSCPPEIFEIVSAVERLRGCPLLITLCCTTGLRGLTLRQQDMARSGCLSPLHDAMKPLLPGIMSEDLTSKSAMYVQYGEIKRTGRTARLDIARHTSNHLRLCCQ